MTASGRVRCAARLAALLVLVPAFAFAQDSRSRGPEDPPTTADVAPPDPRDALGYPDYAKRKKKTPGPGQAMGQPVDRNAGKTTAARSDYIEELLADEARDRRPAMRVTAQRACLLAALDAVPPTASAEVRKAIDESKRLLAARDWAGAHAQAVQASALDWKLLAPRLLAARALEAQGKFRESLNGPLDTAVSSAPADPLALHARALVFWHLERLDDARKDVVQARKASPADGLLTLSLGAIEIDRGEVRTARDLLLAACDALPSDVTALREFVRTLWLGDDWDGAAAVFERIVRMSEGAPLPAGQVAIAGVEPALTEHLALAVLCADRLGGRRPDAKEHARKFLNQGGIDFALDAWLKALAKA